MFLLKLTNEFVAVAQIFLGFPGAFLHRKPLPLDQVKVHASGTIDPRIHDLLDLPFSR